MDNAFKVRTFKEVITDKNNFKEPGAVLGDFIKEGELSVIGLQLIVRKQLFVTISPLPMHQACAIGKNRSVIK